MEDKMNKKKKVTAVVISQQEIATDIYEMWLQTELAEAAEPGQFLCLYTGDGGKLLPRPISICEVGEEKKSLRLVYRVAGAGTREFSGYRSGKEVPVLGCLGNGFPLEEGEGKTAFLIGGGIGVPPILQLAKERNGKGKNIILAGYRNQETFLKEDFEKYGELHIATEDGSVGVKGNVMDIIEKRELHADCIYACGPMPMLRAIKKYAAQQGIKAYISLEERMACGVGACLGCVCKTTKKDSHSNVNNARICTDGPVFEAGEVDI